MKKLLLVLLLSISFVSYADSTCKWQSGNTFKCKEDRRFEGPDMEKAGKGLRNILIWLNENSTSNTNKQPKSYGGNNTQVYVPPNAYKTYTNGKSGFACHYGYKRSGNSCIKQTSNSNYAIPDNAYRTKGTWKCLFGYVRSGNSCFKTNQTLPSQSK
ncbi:hypothetical protein OAR18_03165 [Candidatus Pseudothioglobus singularis]|nr:hypothetical protein [Candidatus Pseudothioglobus singularis]